MKYVNQADADLAGERMMSAQKSGKKKKIVFQTFLFLIPVVVLSLAYLAYTTYKTKSLYFYVKSNQRGWSGKIHGHDQDLGLAARPTANSAAVIRHAYGEIQRVAEENGAKVIIVVMGSNHDPVPVRQDLLSNKAVIADAHGALLKKLPVVDRENYQKHYAHWQGNPPRLVDGHPNEEARRITALEIVTRIAPASGAQPDKPGAPTR